MTTPDLSTREGRDQLRALADAATEGPWEAMDYDNDPGDEGSCILTHEPERGTRAIAYAIAYPWTTPESCEADADLIAAARTAVPALLDALDDAEAGAMKWREHAAGLAQTAAKRDQDRAAAIARADRAEAALQRVRDVLDTWTSRCLTEQNMHPLEPIRRALDDGDPEGKA